MIDQSKIHLLTFKDGCKRQIRFLSNGTTKGHGSSWKLINNTVYVFDSQRVVIGEFTQKEINPDSIDEQVKPYINHIIDTHLIQKAEWGIEGNYIDVTEKARTMFDKDGRVDATTKYFDDHIHGTYKHLLVNDVKVYEHLTFYSKHKALEFLKQCKITDSLVYDFVNQSTITIISKDHIRINVYNENNECYICSEPYNGAGLYCYVMYYLRAFEQANTFKSSIKMSTKDGWSLYKNSPDDDLYSQVFSYNASGKNDVEKYFSPSQRVVDTISLFKEKYNIDPSKTIGVMARGTDKATEVTLPLPEQYIDKCNDILKLNPDYKILLQTDEQPIADLFLQTYGNERVILIDEIPRSKDGRNVFHRELNDKIGLCVYLDSVIRIISDCQYVVKLHKGGIAEIIDKYRDNKEHLFNIKFNSINLNKSELYMFDNKIYSELKLLVWYVAIGDKYLEQTRISINSLLQNGHYNGDIIILSDRNNFEGISEKVKFINILNDYKFKCGFEIINNYYAWCAKSEIVNYIDIDKYDVCMYIDSDVIVQKEINNHFYSCYIDKGIHIQNNGWYTIGRNHESTGNKVLSNFEIKKHQDIGMCAGLFIFYGKDFGLELITRWRNINKLYNYKYHDQGNLTKVIIDNYLSVTKYLSGACFGGSEYNDSLTFVHLGDRFNDYIKKRHAI